MNKKHGQGRENAAVADIVKDSEYRDWLRDLKRRIKSGQVKAALSVNSEMILLYWDIGRQIVEKQEHAKWGSGFIEQLSKDLREEFPEATGYSKDNLLRMRKFYLFYSSIVSNDEIVAQVGGQIGNAIVAQLVPQLQASDKNALDSKIMAQLVQQLQVVDNTKDTISEQLVPKLANVPWGHHVMIMQRSKDIKQALFYVNKTIENNWSRAVLDYQIETDLYGRQGKAVTNFHLTMPAPDSELANEILKDPYNFEFIRLSEKVKEANIEAALVQHITQFLLELGIGFAYMGRQYTLKVGKKEYRTDLLFYHTRLKCYVVIELKAKEFEPEHIGKLNFYVTAVNELVKDQTDKPTIGILLCRNKDNYEVEFSLKGVNTAIGVSTFRYTELDDEIKAAMPSAEELQKELMNFEREFGGIE